MWRFRISYTDISKSRDKKALPKLTTAKPNVVEMFTRFRRMFRGGVLNIVVAVADTEEEFDIRWIFN